MRKPAPATVIALLSLFVALGGSSYAAVSISGSAIKNRSIAGKKLKKDTLTGTEIKESKLGTVPSANNANLLGGSGPSAFLGATAKAADSDKLDGKDSTEFLGSSAKAADSDKLDGKDSTDFLGATAKAADSDKLDGLDSMDLVPASALRRVGPIATSNPAPDGTAIAVTLAVIGQFIVTGECLWNNNVLPFQRVRLYIWSSIDHAAYADLTQAGAGAANGNADMSSGLPYLLADGAGDVGSLVFTPVAGEALSADGHEIFYDLYMGQNARGDSGQKCVFGGSFIVQ